MDNKLTDKGWKSMRERLDREMPEKKRRPFAIWWLAAVFLPLALYGSWLYRNTGDNTRSDSKAPAQVLAQAQKAGTTSGITTPSASTAPASSITTEQTNKRSVNTAVANHATTSRPTIIATAENVTTPTLPAIAQAAISTPSGCIVSNPTALRPLPYIAYLHPIPPSTEPLQLLLRTHKTAETRVKSHPEKARGIEFAATSIVSAERLKQANTFSTGVTFDWRFAGRWGLRSGLFYQIYTPEENSRPVASVEPESYSSRVGEKVVVLDATTGAEVSALSGAGFSSDSLDENVLIPVNRIQKLELPVNVSFQLTRSWKWFGGVSIARSISTKADRVSYSGDYILKVTDRSAIDEVSQLSSGKLRTWTGDAMLGTGWRVSKVIELGMSAKMPFNRLLQINYAKKSGNGSFTPNSVLSQNKRKPFYSLFASIYF